MKKVAVLACPETMPGSAARRLDAFECDIEVQCLEPQFRAIQRQLQLVNWHDNDIDWREFEAVIIRSTWDYTNKPVEFLWSLTEISKRTVLLNQLSAVRWNLDKSYLLDLQNAGIVTVPTRYISEKQFTIRAEDFEEFSADCLVIKQSIGASAVGQTLIHRDQGEIRIKSEGVGCFLVQPFVPSIVDQGEISLIFFGRSLSHAVRKWPKAGDYRVQSLYGGWEEAIPVTEEFIQAGLSSLDYLPSTPLYARVDLVRLASNQLAVMEMELIEPYLYPSYGKGSARAFTDQFLTMMSLRRQYNLLPAPKRLPFEFGVG